MIRVFIFLLLLLLYCLQSKAQETALTSLPTGYLDQAAAKAKGLQEKLDKKTEKTLLQFQKREDKLKHKLQKLDSTKAKQVFGDAQDTYTSLKQKLERPTSSTQYLPFLDTLKTSLKFLEDNKGLLTQAKGMDSKITASLDKVKGLESSLSKAEELKQFVKERRSYLKEHLSGLPFSKSLKKLHKQAYYYSAQVNEYKEAIKDTKKLERKALELLSKTKAFQDFMRKNSQLASMFRLPGTDAVSSSAALQGLQTRASVNQLVQNRIGSSASAQAQFAQNVQAAQGQLSQLKNKMSQYSSGAYGNSTGDIDQPDFKPNTQKTKSFLKRLEYGGNVQSQRARNYFPVTSDLGLSLGYKLNDKSVIGVGASYKLGLGKGWNNLTLSHQGAGVRSYIDYKLKGSIYLSGGYEQNYRTLFTSLEQLKDYSAWQSSGLVGLSKKYSVSKKLKGSVQLLWDFLSYRQTPQTQAVLFRIGYNLK